ncbi:hypothetical protein KCP75_06730 [Salmonella enterica subsp. enterica]|nr:hypothetical protein KCP75_06730 [Salmonella enterica subsp. enterica]
MFHDTSGFTRFFGTLFHRVSRMKWRSISIQASDRLCWIIGVCGKDRRLLGDNKYQNAIYNEMSGE